MLPIRVRYEKTGAARYVSHLDMTRVMSRAIRRAKLPVWYTEGFNPHIYMNFAAPISLGFESLCEAMDLKILDLKIPDEKIPETFLEELNACLPEGIKAYDVYEPKTKLSAISFIEYELTSPLAEDIGAFCDREVIMAEKRSKKGISAVDIRPMFTKGQCTADSLIISCAAGERSLNPSLIVAAFENETGKDTKTSYKRIRFFDENLNIFL